MALTDRCLSNLSHLRIFQLLQHKKRKQIPVFGSRIEDVVDQEDSGLDIPRFVRHAINFLREKGVYISCR